MKLSCRGPQFLATSRLALFTLRRNRASSQNVGKIHVSFLPCEEENLSPFQLEHRLLLLTAYNIKNYVTFFVPLLYVCVCVCVQSTFTRVNVVDNSGLAKSLQIHSLLIYSTHRCK